jgi:ubiquitin C-terminal hydrolase
MGSKNSQQEQGSESLSSPNVKQAKRNCKGINGLKNFGATCYINASLVCLFQIQPLIDYFLSKVHLKEMVSGRGKLVSAFACIAK